MTPRQVQQAENRNEWRDAVWSSGLKPLRRLAALCYADHAGESITHVWVGTRRGMERTGMGRTAWHEARNELEVAGGYGRRSRLLTQPRPGTR